MQTTKCDAKGRVYLKEQVRARYGEKFVILETPEGVLLVPVPADPVADLRELGKALRKHSLKTLKKQIRERARKEALSANSPFPSSEGDAA